MRKDGELNVLDLEVYSLVRMLNYAVFHRKGLKEQFSAESFALAVIAQSQKVFERLAEM